MGVAYSSGGLTWGVCLPEACSALDIKSHVNNVMKSSGGGFLKANFKDDNCFLGHQDITFDTLDIVYTSIISVLALIIINSTVKDLFKVIKTFNAG